MSLPAREEIPDSEKRDPSIVFGSPTEWEVAVDAFEDRLDDLRTFEGRAVEDGETLGDMLDLVEELQVVQLGSIHLYAFLISYVDTTDDGARKRVARYRNLRSEMESAMGFLEPELKEAGRDRVDELIESTPDLESHGPTSGDC